VAVTDVQRIIEQFQIVGAHIQYHRYDPMRIDPCGRRVHRQLLSWTRHM
jgi:hypothetical protein